MNYNYFYNHSIASEGLIMHENNLVDLPYNSLDEDEASNELSIKRVSSMYYRLETKFGLMIEWNTDLGFYITLSAIMKNKVSLVF